MSRVRRRGKETAACVLKVGGIVLALVDAISDTSKIEPGVHLEALNPADRSRERYVRRVAKGLDDELFEIRCLATPRKGYNSDVFGLMPAVETPLFQAFDWAAARGFLNGLMTDEEIAGLHLPLVYEGRLTRGTIGFLNPNPGISCRLVGWDGNRTKGSVQLYTLPLDHSDVIKSNQLLIMTKPHKED